MIQREPIIVLDGRAAGASPRPTLHYITLSEYYLFCPQNLKAILLFINLLFFLFTKKYLYDIIKTNKNKDETKIKQHLQKLTGGFDFVSG